MVKTLDQRLGELEQAVKDLQQELAVLKEKKSVSRTRPVKKGNKE